MNKKILVSLFTFLVIISGLKYFNPKPAVTKPPQYINRPAPLEEIIKVEPPQLSTVIPYHLSYAEIINQLKKWNEEAKDLTEVGTYGLTTRKYDLYYIKCTNKLIKKDKPKVLITACIHGNEPWATGIVMAYIGTILNQYSKSDEVKKLLDEREVWFIPVVSPDSFPHSRIVDGVDPNRNFPNEKESTKRSVPPVQALRDLFMKENFNAVASCHTWGRQYLIPWGHSYDKIPHDKEYKEIVGKMAEMSDYQYITPKEIYNKPIYGTEVDWYYMNGAMGIVIEFGTHQKIPSKQDIDYEFNRTYQAILLFIDKAPLAVSR